MVTLEPPEDFDLFEWTYYDFKKRRRMIKEDTPPNIRRKVEVYLRLLEEREGRFKPNRIDKDDS